MLSLETLTDKAVLELVKKNTYTKAIPYLGRIRNAQRMGNRLWAQVQGTRLYEVSVEVEPQSILATCTCHYSWGGHCKHMVALLLAWVRDPQKFTHHDVVGDPDVVDVALPTPQPPASKPAWLVATPAEQEESHALVLADYLEPYTMQSLRGIASARGWTVRGTRKADIIEQLVVLMQNRGEAAKGIYSQNEEHQRVLRVMTLLGGMPEYRLETLQKVVMQLGELKQHARVDTYTRHLWERGLAISGEAIHQYPPVDVVPWVLVRNFPPMLETVIPSTALPEKENPESRLVLGNPEFGVREVTRLLILLDQQSTALRPLPPRHRLESYYPHQLEAWPFVWEEVVALKGKESLNRPSADLALTVPAPPLSFSDETLAWLSPNSDPSQVEFFYRLLVAAGILQSGSPVTAWDEGKAEFFQRSEASQLAILAQAYFQMTNWSELWAMQRQEPRLALKRLWRMGGTNYESLLAVLANRRDLVIRMLAMLPDNRWIQTANLRTWLQIFWPQFHVSIQTSPYYSFSSRWGMIGS